MRTQHLRIRVIYHLEDNHHKGWTYTILDLFPPKYWSTTSLILFLQLHKCKIQSKTKNCQMACIHRQVIMENNITIMHLICWNNESFYILKNGFGFFLILKASFYFFFVGGCTVYITYVISSCHFLRDHCTGKTILSSLLESFLLQYQRIHFLY